MLLVNEFGPLQLKVVAVVTTDKFMVCPVQTKAVPVAVAVGTALTVTVEVAVAEQEPAVPVTVYIVVAVGVAVTVAPDVALNPVAGIQL